MAHLFAHRCGCHNALIGMATRLFVVSLSLAIAGAAPVSAQTLSNLLSILTLHWPRFGAPPGQIGIAYTPEARCSDNNWSTATPVACNPQLSFSCAGNQSLSVCPTTCQACYNNDLNNLRTTLNVSTITSYQPNYYILTAAKNLNINVMQGLFNDAIPSLAAPDISSNCSYAGSPIALCGSNYANAMLNGACGTTTPWNPANFCSNGAYIEPLAPFIKSNTIIAIQLGNEALGTIVNGQTITVAMISKAAQTLRNALKMNGFLSVPIVVSLVMGQEQTVCTGGSPPQGVDFIASHPYCNFVASVPPSWQENGSQCWQQVQTLFSTVSQRYCGAFHTFIGETGYNTGCPGNGNAPVNVSNEQMFIKNLKAAVCTKISLSGFPTFLFAYSDVCPASGCAAGCSGGPVEGNGYFGIFHTQNYMTEGPLVPKFTPVPSLTCP
jgi:hypothetical protein